MEIALEECKPLTPFRTSYKQSRVLARQKSIEFTFNCKEEDAAALAQCSIHLDPTRFEQVMRNLLTNAFKFTPERGSVRMVVSKVTRNLEGSLQQQQQQQCVRLEVVDSGAGISKENQTKLFGQYVQFDANKLQKGGGSGLGLWICKGE